MAPKKSGVEDFPVDNLKQDILIDPGNSSRELQRQDCPAVEPAPTVEIVEQPAEESRFRYSRESRTNGSILGVNSTERHKTYPSVRVNSYIGLVRIRVSCVSKNSPHSPHPHNIVGRDCGDGVCIRQAHIREQNQTLELMYIGIQCTKREDYASTLQKRARMGVDPFGSGFNTPLPSNQSHYVRLAIEVFIPDSCGGWQRYGMALSDVITDLPTKLKIFHISQKYGSAHGGTQLTLLTSRLPNIDQLVVRFQDLSSGWRVDMRPQRVHHLVSLVVATPPCRPDTYCSVPVTIHLVRPPTGDPDVDKHMVGEPCHFLYTPGPDYDPISSRAPKRQRTDQKQLHPALRPDQDDRESADSPPEPQPSTSTGKTDSFMKLDQWYSERVQTPQTSQEIRETQNLVDRAVHQPTHLQSLTRNPLQESSSLAYPQREHYQGDQLTQSSSISNSQTSQNRVLKGSSGASFQDVAFAERLPHGFSNQLPVVLESKANKAVQLPQSKTLVRQGSVVNTDLRQWRSPNALLAQGRLTPQSVQNNLITLRSNSTAQSNYKRNHSQMAGNPSSSRSNNSNPILEQPSLKTQSSQTEQNLSRPTYLGSERPNSQIQHPHSKAIQGIPQALPVASILERIPLSPHNQMFLEIPPTDFESNMAIGAAVPSSIPQFPLVDLTGQNLEVYSMARSLDPHELRYFETTESKTSWAEILSSTSQEQWTCPQPLPTTEDEQASTLNSNMASSQANPGLDIEILSLSDEIRKLLNFI